jgi:hypothetical protein
VNSIHVAVAPVTVDVGTSRRAEVTVSITNNSPLIDGYSVRVFGLDPEWLDFAPHRISLFPGDTGEIVLTITLPVGYPAGVRELSFYVGSENDADDFVVTGVVLDVASKPKVRIGLDPQSQAAGSKAQYGLIVANLGNTAVDATAMAIDPEEEAEFSYEPQSLTLLAGDQDVVRVSVRAKRPWFGQPKVRVLSFVVNTPEPVETMGTMVQRPRIGRGLITLLGLIAAAAVFGAVLLRTLSGVVDQAAIDDQIVERALAATGEDGATVSRNPGSIRGVAVSGVDGGGLAGLTATLYGDDPSTPLGTSATSDTGAFIFDKLGAGTYRVKLSGAGFADSWYAGGTEFVQATELVLDDREQCDLEVTPACEGDGSGSDTDGDGGDGSDGGTAGGGSAGGAGGATSGIALTGLPGTVGGKVAADDPTGATATLVIASPTAGEVDAVAATIDVSADGSFSLVNVPTPQVYTLKVERNGSATALRTIDLGPGQVKDDLLIRLDVGAGVITGLVTSDGLPVPGATIDVSDGTTTLSTVSLTEGEVGSYTVRDLSVPGTYTVTVTADRFAPASQVVVLTDDDPTPSIRLFLTPSVGRISGVVTNSDNEPLGGVSVRVAGGETVASSATVSTGDIRRGGFEVANLPVPGSYTVTFSRPGYLDQVVLVALEPVGTRFNRTDLRVALRRDLVSVTGRVLRIDGSAARRATVTLTDGVTTRTVLTADTPAGRYTFSGVAPGSYTLTARLEGTQTALEIINATPGAETLPVDDIRLSEQASIEVTVEFANPQDASSATEIRLYAADRFPSTNLADVLDSIPIGDGVRNGDLEKFLFVPVGAPTDYVVAIFDGPTSTSVIASLPVSSVAAQRVLVEFAGVPAL